MADPPPHRAVDPVDPQAEDVAPSELITVEPQGAGGAVPGVSVGTWGRYRLDRRVGDGGFGSVYLGWDPDLELEVAIKILHRRVADARLKAALLQEGRALAKVQHPHVVRVLAVESHEDQIGLCMEFVRGETLEVLVRRGGPMDARQAAVIGQEVCGALAAVHLAGYVHRDVKARNIMQERGGRVVLMDFGAGQQSDPTRPGARTPMIGTPLYMAPEVLAGGSATQSSDIYSVGVLLYFLVTGKYPVEGHSLEEIRSAHMMGRRHLLSVRRPELAVPFVRVVERALASDPSRRYESAGQFMEELGTVLGEPAGESRPWYVTSLLRGVAVVFASVAALTALGAISAQEFNLVLGRTAFVSEGARAWFVVGLRSVVAPAAVLMLIMLTTAVLVVLRRLLITVSATGRRFDAACVQWLRQALHRARLDDPAMGASIALLLSATLVLGSWWYFQDLLGAMLQNISVADAGSLWRLSSANVRQHDLYRQVLIYVTTAGGVLWYMIARLGPRTSDTYHRALWWGAAAVFVFALGLLEFPYRVLRDSKFDVVRVDGGECYELGERRDEVLLFCPASAIPRSRIVKKAIGREPTGRHESIFVAFEQASATSSPVSR